MEPSIKGSVVKVTLDELRDLVHRGVLSETKLRGRLEPEVAAFALDRSITISDWYPARLYDAVLRTMVQELHGGRIQDLAERGRDTARELAEKGIYAQLKRPPDGRSDPSLIRLIISLSGAIYNFTSWELGAFEDGAFEIVISDADAYPDTFMWRNVGFVEVATTLATGHPWSVTCTRPTRDRIVLRVTRVPT